ncbi:hypothetical protein D3C85_1444460 [compost metagenome]
MLIAQRQRGHGVVRMVLQHADLQNAALLLFRQPRVHHAAAPHFLQRTKGFDAAVFQHQHVVRQVQNFIQRMADVEHRNVYLACQTLQIRQQLAFTR